MHLDLGDLLAVLHHLGSLPTALLCLRGGLGPGRSPHPLQEGRTACLSRERSACHARQWLRRSWSVTTLTLLEDQLLLTHVAKTKHCKATLTGPCTFELSPMCRLVTGVITAEHVSHKYIWVGSGHSSNVDENIECSLLKVISFMAAASSFFSVS